MITNVLRHFNVIINGTSYAGVCEKAVVPQITLDVKPFRGGGMDAPMMLDLGQKEMKSSCSLYSYDPNAMSQWGLYPTAQNVQVQYKGHLMSQDGTESGAIYQCNGLISDVKFDDWKPGEKCLVEFHQEVYYFSVTINGQQIYLIDIMNGIRQVNGVNVLANMATLLGTGGSVTG